MTMKGMITALLIVSLSIAYAALAAAYKSFASELAGFYIMFVALLLAANRIERKFPHGRK